MKPLDNVFHELHKNGLLILANVSDAGGAKVVESLGAAAIATSSAGMAWAHGYTDGNQLPLTRLAASVESMTRILHVPLTVDIEAGYSDDLQHVARVVEAVVASGPWVSTSKTVAHHRRYLCAKSKLPEKSPTNTALIYSSMRAVTSI